MIEDPRNKTGTSQTLQNIQLKRAHLVLERLLKVSAVLGQLIGKIGTHFIQTLLKETRLQIWILRESESKC